MIRSKPEVTVSETRWTRRDFLRGSAVAAGLVAAPGLLGACQKVETGGGGQGSALDKAKQQGFITVGFAGEAPYAYQEGGKLTGEDPAVHQAIWKAVGVNDLRGVQVDFGQLIPGLNANRFDVVAAGMFILPERCQQAAFSEPVYCAPNAFLVPKGNPKNISDFKSVEQAGIKVGVLSGAVEGLYAQKSGVSSGKIVQLASQRDGLAALSSDRVGAFALTSISLRNMLKDNPDASVELTTPFTPVIDGKEQLGCGGAVFRKADNDLREAFNTELAKLKQSGQLVKLIEPFGFGPETVPPNDVTTEQLCQA
jgi:polar amino acid transport system substrate-binding protein